MVRNVALDPTHTSIRKEVIYLVDYCLVAIIGIALFVLVILDLIDELKR